MDKGHFAEVNGIQIHYLDNKTDQPPMLLLHSLSANAHIFQGLIAHGLNQHFRLIAPDLRGRGLSQRTPHNYSLAEESKDLIGLLDVLEIDRVTLAGHSFGGLLAIYFAAHYPERVKKLILLDAAVSLNPLTPALINYSTVRLLKQYPSWETYLEFVRHAPFMDRWDAAMLPFLRADVIELADGRILPKNHWYDITRAAGHLNEVTDDQWRKYVSAIKAPTLLVHASAPYAHGQHIVTRANVIQTIALLQRGDDLQVEGNHITMLFGNGAGQITAAMRAFAKETAALLAA